MRIDKFLKNSRLIKRRSVAKEACDGGRIRINDKVAKAGDKVEEGDIIDIRFGNSLLSVKVLRIFEHVTKSDSQELYEIISKEASDFEDAFEDS
jgi:ribosomal 50S subunit-recycling heat shock protein